MAVHGFNQQMYEFQNCKLILQCKWQERGNTLKKKKKGQQENKFWYEIKQTELSIEFCSY